jgi:hypothetical protein
MICSLLNDIFISIIHPKLIDDEYIFSYPIGLDMINFFTKYDYVDDDSVRYPNSTLYIKDGKLKYYTYSNLNHSRIILYIPIELVNYLKNNYLNIQSTYKIIDYFYNIIHKNNTITTIHYCENLNEIKIK